MKRFWLAFAASAGLAAMSLPASANMVTYTLNCSTVVCASPTNYGTVTLDDHNSTGSVTVTVALAPNTFAGTGAGYAINWNIDPGQPALTTTKGAATAGYDPTHFDIIDSTNGVNTYSASTFGSGWEYAIDYNQHGGNASNDNKLIFDVGLAGLTINNFVPNDGFMFAVDIWDAVSGKTFVVAAKVPEPATWLMFFAGLAGLTYLLRRRRVFARAA